MSITEQERKVLIENMTNLLEEYNYEYSYDALAWIIDDWQTNKATLIDAFKKHPNYLEGKFMIAFDCDYTREMDKRALRNFSCWLDNNIWTVKNFMPQEMIELAERKSCVIPPDIYNLFASLYCYTNQFITQETADAFNAAIPELKATAGQKMSRVVNKACSIVGYDKLSDYNREFAKYADALNPLTIKRHTVLSINPLDYLTMSFGNSWASCHTIDKSNKRNMPNAYSGCYSSGTISYMLDPTSMVLYTVDAAYNGDEYWTQPKINRQMFHYGEEKLVQSRLYPQSNDGYGEEYTPYRNIVQEIIATVFDLPNLWTISKGTEAAGRYIVSRGTHYRDYNNFSNCNLSRVKGSENENCIQVGHNPICVECGEYHSNAETINCCNSGMIECEDCGCLIHEDNVVYVNGEAYCRDCVHYCECCDEYHRDDETWIESEDRYVCEDCLNRYYHYCSICDEYHYEDDCYWIENEDMWVCDSCYDNHFRYCYKCGETFRKKNMHIHDGQHYCESCFEEVVSEDEEDEVDEAV